MFNFQFRYRHLVMRIHSMVGETLLTSEVYILLLIGDQSIRDLLICTVPVLLVTVGSLLLPKHVSMRSVSKFKSLKIILRIHSIIYTTSIHLETNPRLLIPQETFSEIKLFVILSHCKKLKTNVLQPFALVP